MRQEYGYIKKVEMIPIQFPPQQQPFQPGLEWMMVPLPVSEDPNYRGSGKLARKNSYHIRRGQRYWQSGLYCICQGGGRPRHCLPK